MPVKINISAVVAMLLVLSVQLTSGKEVDFPAINIEKLDVSAHGTGELESMVTAEKKNSLDENDEKEPIGSGNIESEPETKSSREDKEKGSSVKSKPLKPFVPSEKIPGEQAVDFPVDI